MADQEIDEDERDDADENDGADENEAEDEEGSGNGGGSNGQRSGFVEALKHQLGEHKEVLAPVATSAAAAAATYAAKKLPDLIGMIEDDGADKLRSKLKGASDAGGVKGFVSGAASRAFSGGGGSLIDRLKQGGEDEAKEETKERGGALGAAAKVADKVSGGGSAGGYGWGKGRRLPIMQSVDVAATLETVYDQWTQLEEMSSFMHRVEGVEQKEPETVVWTENIWGRKRNWNVEITEQIPRERIAWEIKGGGQGVGVITFHALAPKLTRIEVVFDWQPRGIVEKLGSGMRVHRRAARTDLYRFKAFVETRNDATGGWRGRIEDGSVKAKTRNRPNRSADPIPDEARQHSEGEGDANGDEADDSTAGNDEKGREAAREERRRGRAARAGDGRKRVTA
ncbi:MAG TPA: SRPBCC family protein [Gaiellaceae bacterium]|jgi:uncharacterized membrane protein